ncbi:atp-binding cassette sub-family a member 13 [Limosa lapponica baueri]|uniref:Atp-binding cassette sub-family a member 13 n=1 Tax=Limosa lapponica baueri TaxID=1758121 RepID=A0A2I0UPL4_LIMLA|nr:atp-binding cassette sub-family a member 13 [Limosa lapponica baueri]
MCLLRIKMDLNEVEEIISKAENLYKQPYFWNLLHSLPHLELNSFYTEDGLAAIAQFLKVIQNTLASLKDLAMMPLGKSFYEMVKTALNLTAASIEERSLEGFQYNLSLGDILWNPRAVRSELESRFGFDDLHVEKLLNYTVQLTKIPTGETLEQFVCSALSSVQEDEANKENNEEGCISVWHEAKLYLVHAVSKLRLYAQVFEQWFSSSFSQKLLLELDDLMSQFLDDREARKIFSEINTPIQRWNEKSNAYFSEGYTAPHDLILHLERMQSVLQDIPQWPVMKRLLLVDGAIRNIIAQYLYFTEETLRSLEKQIPFAERDGFIYLDIRKLFVELKQMLMSNASYICSDVLKMLEKTLRLPQGSDDIDILAIYVCPGNGSEVTFKLSDRVQSLKESVLLLQKVTQGQQSLPASKMDDYLGWQEIEEQLTKNYAYYCEINQLLSTEAPPEEDVHFTSCREQLLFSLANQKCDEYLINRLETSLCSRQKLSLETILGHYLAFLQDLPDYSSFISWARILTSFKEFLSRQENLQISGEKEMDHLFHLVEVIKEIIMLDFSASSNQSLIENVLNNTITWMKNFAEGKESATNFSLAVSELHNELHKNFKPLQRFWTKEKTEVFWHIVRTVLYELHSRLSHLSQVEEEEVLETLSRIMFFITENKIHNRSMLLLKNILTDWPELNIPALNHLKHLSENFLRNLYEVRSLTDDYVNMSFSTIHGLSNASLFLSNAIFMYKVQELEEIVHNFFKNIQKLNSSSVASLVPMLFSLYQNDDLVLNSERNSTLLTFLYETSKDISLFQVWHDLQDKDQVFDFLSETFELLWNFTSRSLCEKLLIIYNYTEYQAQSLAQKGKKEMQVVYSTLSILKTLFIDEELQTAAICYLEQFLDISPECLVNNGCIDFYPSNITSVDHSAEVYSLLFLPLDSVLSNITNLGDKVNVPSALHCTFTWLQTWTEIFEEAAKILHLNSTFFVCLSNDLANLSESLLNVTNDELCNNTAMVVVETATAAMNLLKIIFEGGGDLNDWKDLEASLANLQSIFINAVDVTSSLKGNSLESVLDTMGIMITELQKSILKVANGEFLNSWLDTFISGRSKGEDKSADVFSIGNSLSTILKLSQKELGIILTEIKDTTAFFESVPQGKYMVCISIFQNITKLILDSSLKDISHSQTNFSSHLNSFLHFYSTADEAEDCNRWIRGLSNLSERYKSLSHLESAKHILFLLKSLGNIETDAKLMNVMDFVNLIFNLILPECSITGSDVICVNVYFNIIAKTLKFILPEFYVKDDISVLEFIFTLLNNSEGQIKMVVNDLVGDLQNTSNKTHFSPSIQEFNRTSRMFLNSFRHVQLSSVELLAEIQTLLKNKTFEIHENSFSHLDVEIEPFLHEKNTSFLMEFFQYVVSKLDSDLQDEQKTFLQKLIETAALNIELVRKALKIFKSSNFTGFPLRDDKEFLKHMVALMQNMRNMDVEFLLSQFEQVQESLDNFFNNIKPLYIEMSELGMLTNLWDEFENNLCNGNLTGLWQITRVFKQDEIYDVEEVFNLLVDVISLVERLAHGNITEALTEVYAFILTHEAKMPMFTEEEFSNQVESLLMLLETLTDMSDEPAESSICFSASFCWTLTTATPQSDPTFKPCDFVHSNSTLSYDAVIEVIKELKLITLEDSSSCTMEDFQAEITHNLTCFFHQIKEWNSILLKFSELHHVNDSVLKELLDFWNELSAYAVPLQVNDTYSINCSSTLKRQVALQIVETLASMPVAEMEMAKRVLEQVHDLYGGLSWNRHSRTSFIKTVLTNFKNMTSEVSGLLDTEAVLSFFSVIQPVMTLSSVGNHTYSILMTLAALNGNSNISDNFENFWFPIVTNIEDLLVNFNVRHALVMLDQEFQLLRLATGQSSSMDLDDLIQRFNTSSVDAMLRNFEDLQEILNSFLCECHNKNDSKIMHALILLMANEDSLNDLLLFVKDIVEFLELFQNKSKEDYTGMLFVDGHLSREKLNNTHTANSVLLNSLFHIVTDLSVIEEALHTNKTELQIVDFFDSFFDNAQYREVSTQSQNRTMEIMQDILQTVFQSTTEHDRNKITFSLKDLHKDIMAEMRASKICKILQKHLYPASFLLLQKLQFTILNVLKIFSEEPVVIGNLFCATKCKDGLTSHVVLSVIEGISLVRDHYQDIERMWPSFNKGDCVKVKECVQNLSQLRLDVGSSVNISEETISTILEASISHSKVFYSAFLVALTGRCDEELLSLLLKLPENSKTSLVVEELCSLPALDLYTMFVMIIQNLNLRHIIYKVKIPSEIGNVLNMLLDVVSSISSLLDKAHHVMENLPVFLQGIQDIGVLDISALWQFLQGGQFRSSAVGSLESVIKAVCKEESSFFSNANLFIDMPRIMGLLEDNMAKYGIPEDSTPFCLKLYHEILESSNGALLWTFLKPLLHGKILYNSNINMIDLVMEKANFTFGFVENLKAYSETWLRMSEVFKTSGNVLTVSQLQEALQSNFIKHFIESNLDIDMEKLLKKMQVYETMMNKMLNSSASKQIDLLSQLVVNISSCVLLDRFQPFDSVEKLEEKAHELMQQNNFLASIIFDMPKNKTEDSSKLLPRHISYTIRTSVLYSMRTDLIKNPAWKSHPQKLPADGFKYNHIFIPLQDMIERAIISAQTGTDTLVPAIQVQAMPYPCHTSDLFLNNIGFFFPLMMMLTWMVSVAGMVRKLVYEREIHLEECLLSTTAFGQGVFFVTFFEGQEIGIQWNNVHQSMAQGGYMTFGWICWMMFFDSILYSIGGWYFSNIIPGKFGLKNRWYFPFTLSYWKNLCGAERRKRHYLNSNMFFFNENFQEKDPAPPGWKGPCMEGATIGVVLLSLTKEHVDGQKAAVKDLSLTFHRGQITALLGPNGAGKTTVISLLTGQYPPSSGTIIINGKDIRTDLAAIRTELGVCPQYDVLFNILTVREHLLLYGSVKAPGWTTEQLNQYVSGALEDVDLSQHQYKPVGALSGGMKRRLSIAISFIGNSKTVVLDEPTSGVDPCSRRSIWDVLLKYKAGCTLIFTTHHLDEAEVLSDRIAILQRGQLRCCGSPSYLRETYGQGHSLTLIKKDPEHIFRVTSLVQTHIPEAFLKENNGTELTYVIPERADKTSFKGLFQALDQSLHHLHVTGYGISDTTLEEFLYFVEAITTALDKEKMCPSFNTSAPYMKNKKGHILYNLSGFLVEEYLVRPSNKARYGGWSFGGRKAFELQDKKLNNTKSKPLVKVWYNQKAFHSLPSYLNELNNFILWLNLPPNVDWRQYGITLYSQPYGGALLDEDKIMENVRQCGVALCIMLGFSILTASIGSAIVRDRVSGTKRLQHITGLGYKTYWLANFCCDMLFYMVPVTLCVGVISAFQLSAFTFRKNLAATVLLLILFGYVIGNATMEL